MFPSNLNISSARVGSLQRTPSYETERLKESFLEQLDDYEVKGRLEPLLTKIEPKLAKEFADKAPEDLFEESLPQLGSERMRELVDSETLGSYFCSSEGYLHDYLTNANAQGGARAQGFSYPNDPRTKFYVASSWSGVEARKPHENFWLAPKDPPHRFWKPVEGILPYNQRPVGQTLNPQKLAKVMEEIKEKKQIDPIAVAPVRGGGLAIVDGVHRFHACLLLGIPDVPVTPGLTFDEKIFFPPPDGFV